MAFCSAVWISASFVSFLLSYVFIIAFKYVKAFSLAEPVFLCKYTSVNTVINDTCWAAVGVGFVVSSEINANAFSSASGLLNINLAAA